MQHNILILFAHPRLERSKNHHQLLQYIPKSNGITLHDLYEEYPDFNIDVKREKELLTQHDIIIWQHPFYWYSIPPLLKQWIDAVFEFGWAYGTGGTALRGKKVLHVITTGDPETVYAENQPHSFTIPQLLAPLQQTARECGMEFLPPFVIHNAHRLPFEELEKHCRDYYLLLALLQQDNLPLAVIHQHAYINYWVQNKREA